MTINYRGKRKYAIWGLHQSRKAGNLDALLAMRNNHSTDLLMPFLGKFVEWPRNFGSGYRPTRTGKKKMPTNFITWLGMFFFKYQ